MRKKAQQQSIISASKCRIFKLILKIISNSPQLLSMYLQTFLRILTKFHYNVSNNSVLITYPKIHKLKISAKITDNFLEIYKVFQNFSKVF